MWMILLTLTKTRQLELQSVPDRCTELVGELARQGPGIGAIDGERERDVARSSHREAVPGARFTMSSG